MTGFPPPEHPFSEHCGCLFCTNMYAAVSDIWEVLSLAEKGAFHRTWVPGRHVER
jgi:hypothetical protein